MFPSTSFGLSNLNAYNSDSDSSDSDENQNTGAAKNTAQFELEKGTKRKYCENSDIGLKLPKESKGNIQVFQNEKYSVPNAVLNMFSDSLKNTPTDDPALHNGRVRSIPHVRGNWISYIYIPCSDVTSLHSINELIFTSCKLLDLETNIAGEIHSIDEKHLSLSKTQPFRHHWIEPFTSNFKQAINVFHRMDLVLTGFDVYVNDEGTRTFIGINVEPVESLIKLVDLCDTCLKEFDLQPYYTDAKFHISCAWTLGNTELVIKEYLLPDLARRWKKLVKDEPTAQLLNVDRIEFKTGNKIYQFMLPDTY